MDSAEVTSAGERLRRLEAVADSALSRLDVADLLDELLDRVCDLIDADTAAILLLDPNTRQLVPTAAKGLGDEVRRGVRIPAGHGFAGRIARERQPIVLTEVGPHDVVSPLLAERVRSLLGVPIFAAGDVIGVLHVGTLLPRAFTDDDIRLLQLAADRASAAGQIRSHQIEQAAALALQRSLLPPKLSALPGLAAAARYEPGHGFGVGGDWYDLFTLPSGWLGVVIGDVSGHGLASAVVMGRIRSALRAYALISGDPAEVLTLLDQKVQHFEAGSLTTCLYAMISADRETVLLSCAGHLRPLLAVPGHLTALLDVPVDPPLGIIRRRARRRSTAVDFAPGSLLMCYTDGLVERRDQIIDVGIKALTDTVHADDPESACTAAMSVVAGRTPSDDIAVLSLRRT
ncbi:PP2C family protein-serine/threonine phosphatase [Paractinoplanes lichenicola]|uniref:SpoIIE family protein phosphatase n=1 Tax=Paractinoplanes lichenicola TaxID=2802976 RepID=A0ABS1VWC7_9ACTN|nr:GAF domain-containing SpoIIE family protein phosphatase [Actinoplanes lichenicola]MBL7258791.1 SpoIIE family protein phosphatase [Actinoplanes lichenicola]